jgi:hypothetical protein
MRNIAPLGGVGVLGVHGLDLRPEGAVLRVERFPIAREGLEFAQVRLELRVVFLVLRKL